MATETASSGMADNGLHSVPITHQSVIEQKAIEKVIGANVSGNSQSSRQALPLTQAVPVANQDTASATRINETEPILMAEAVYDQATVASGAVYYASGSAELEKIKASHQQSGGVGVLFIMVGKLYYTGRFVVPRKLSFVCIMHGCKIDLSDAEFVHPITYIDLVAIMGGCKLIVPPGVSVKMSGVAILGGFKSLANEPAMGSSGPVIVVRGVSILGGAKVMTNTSKPSVLFKHLA